MYDLKTLFTKDSIVRYLTSLPPILTPVMDNIFTDRPQLGLPVVGADLVRSVANTLPVVRRGAPSIPATSASGSLAFYEPLAIRPNNQVTGMDLNNLQTLKPAGREAWAVQKTELLRQVVRKTTEAMCAKVLSGSLAWPVQLEGGGYDSYEVSFGSILSVTPATLWSAAGAKLKDVFISLQAMEEAIQEKGYGSVVKIWAGKTAYEKLFGLAEASVTTAKFQVEIKQQGINVGGYLVERRIEKNRNPQTGSMVSVVADNDVLMVALDAGHKLVYCAVDDLDANLQPMPFFVKPIKLDDPSGYKLVAESKPFPLPNVEGICKATVAA